MLKTFLIALLFLSVSSTAWSWSDPFGSWYPTSGSFPAEPSNAWEVKWNGSSSINPAGNALQVGVDVNYWSSDSGAQSRQAALNFVDAEVSGFIGFPDTEVLASAYQSGGLAAVAASPEAVSQLQNALSNYSPNPTLYNPDSRDLFSVPDFMTGSWTSPYTPLSGVTPDDGFTPTGYGTGGGGGNTGGGSSNFFNFPDFSSNILALILAIIVPMFLLFAYAHVRKIIYDEK